MRTLKTAIQVILLLAAAAGMAETATSERFGGPLGGTTPRHIARPGASPAREHPPRHAESTATRSRGRGQKQPQKPGATLQTRPGGQVAPPEQHGTPAGAHEQ